MSLYLCVDCGGSKTSAVVCDSSGKVLGRSLDGPSNFAYLGLDAFSLVVHSAVSNALKASSEDTFLPTPSKDSLAAAWFGVSGVDTPAAVASVTPVLSALVGIPPGPRLIITNDTHLLAAPVRLYSDISHVVACIAGTGSICVSFRGSTGKLEELGRVGGWGWILGDEGGGFHVGREAIRQLLMEHDIASLVNGTPPETTGGKSTLKARVLEYFGIADILEILTIVHLPDPSPSALNGLDIPPHLLISRQKRLSSLSPLVFASAFEDADPRAINILRVCAGILASQIEFLLCPADDRTTNLSRTVKAVDSVICFGGSLVGVEGYRQMILDDLRQRGHVFRYVEFTNDAAAMGASGLAAAYGTTA
jgi:N-acetylglucosamine kinase-like BadF-type ATPase